ncbi:tetratricopeptide repeat protein [Aquisalimonas lutea]|uniref:tetratricopeptide repeat protein n=1 Tax=Aquisalimonas lutea TaxID=1327750 RepID=UPI0025B44949|nr:tetratricopeptide repeat protein [Aquisalimonas lutea]MDN3519236.1 tetratricopeptide repeat protein [Aquisalimonas lutea]
MTEMAALDPESLSAADHAAFAETVADASARELMRRLNRHAARQDAPLVLSGGDTAGVLAAWSRGYAGKHPEAGLFAHFVGCTAESRSTERLLERLLLWLRRLAALPDPLPVAPEDRREILPNWLGRAAARYRLVVVLDAVDRLTDADPEQAVAWLPDHLPPGVRIVAGVSASSAVAENLRLRGWQVEGTESAGSAGAEDAGTPESIPPAVLRMLWASRRGLTAAELEAAGHAAPAAQGPVYQVDGRLQLAGAGVRDAVRRSLLPDGVDRQAAHRTVAEIAETAMPPERRLDELPWQLTRARDWEHLARFLADPDVLLALLHQPDRLDLTRWWHAWGSDAELVAWYAQRLPGWRAALAGESLAELLLLLCAAFRDQIPGGDLTPFMEELAFHEESLPAGQRARALALRGSWLAEQERPEAEGLLQDALERRLERLGADHPETRTSRHQLATWHEARGNGQAAVELYRAALRAREQSLGEGDPGLIPYLTNLGAVLKAMDDPAAAKPHFRRALTIAEKHYGNRHPTTAACLDNLAGVVYAEHDFDQAETLYQRALGIAETVFGPAHAATAAAAHNLGAVMDAREEYRTAEMLFQRALDIREELFGAEHVDTASSLHNLAGVKDAMGRYDEAEPLYRKAIANWETLVGRDHPATATSVNNLADLLRETGQHGEAEQLYRRNLETWRGLMGEEHPHTLMTLCELAALYAEQKRFDDAEPMLRDAVERTARILGRDNMDHINAVTRLAGLLRDTGRRDEARELLRRTITSVEGTLGMISPRLQKLRRHLDALDVDPDRLH